MAAMSRDTLIVSERGQITLPKRVRERLAIRAGSALIVEEVDGGLVLRPALVTPLRVYGDEEIRRWLDADRLTTAQRTRILTKARVR